jgi:hypothetical protein
MGQTLSIRPSATVDALPWLQRAISPKADTTAGLCTLQDSIHGAQCFTASCDGKTVFAYALKLIQHDRGAVVWIAAAGGDLPGASLTASVLPYIEQQARDSGARQVAIATRRGGLIKQLEKMGYTVSGVILRKNLTE